MEEKIDKKLVFLCIAAVALLLAVVVLVCIFFFAPAPSSNTPSAILPSSEIVTDIDSSAEASSEEPSSMEMPSSEEPSSEIPLPSVPEPVSSSAPVPSTPVVSSKPAASSKPVASSKPASSAPSSTPSSSAASSKPPASITGEVHGWDNSNVTAKLTAGGSKSYYLDVPDGSIITCYAYDSNVTVTQSGKNLTVKTSLNSEPYSEIAVQVINKEQTDYIQFVIYLEVTKPDQVGESFYNADDFSNTFFSLMESERRKRSLRPYEYNYDLEMGASTRATEVAMSFSHTRPDGTGYKTVYGEDANGHTYSEIMYRVSVNSADASAVFYAMMDSAEGKTAILSQDFDSAGFGFWVSGSTLYIVGHFVY